MASEYRHNHYVPVWYQKRFLPPGQVGQELYYLDFVPRVKVDPRGVKHPIDPVKKQGFRFCFAQNDLYTVNLGGVESKDIEKVFLSQVDNDASAAVECWTNYTHFGEYDPKYGEPGKPLKNLLLHMSTQKLRTPKGLAWLTQQVRRDTHSDDRNLVLRAMFDLREIYSAIWAECVWQIADASQSETKFIVSDHPVTVYNRRCGPKSQWCRGQNDPDIRFHASHTIFPLSLEKMLILTNLSWVRNPYQSEVKRRPNPDFFRETIFNFEKIQVMRHLSEDEVRQINFIIKSRALRYLGAAKEEWLYPEEFVSKSNWNTYGDGWLLMPDPRSVNIGGTVRWGAKSGKTGAQDEYGRKPWDEEFEKETASHAESRSLYRFQGEFARRFGPYRRGRCIDVGRFDKEKDSDSMHAHHLANAERYK